MHAGHSPATVRAMTRIDDAAAAQVADAMQAAYFRRSLSDEREQLCSEIADATTSTGVTTAAAATAQRLGSHLRSAESQVHYLDRLIARLDHRFGDQLTERD
jgi:acyl-CoA reductase-like NAD-dependent aldehyde dehydrogenase